MLWVLTLTAAFLIFIVAGSLAWPIVISLAVAVAIYTIAKTAFEHKGWKTYMFEGAAGVSMVVILTFLLTLLL